jgi:hypothetical protein
MSERRMDGDETAATPDAPAEAGEPPAAATSGSGLVARLPRRRTWLLLGRTLGGFGAFLAAIVAATQFAFGGDDASRDPSTSAAPSNEPYSYVERRDASGRIALEVPTAWGNVDGGAWAPTNIGRLDGPGPIGRKLVAAPNLGAWETAGELTTPGVLVGLSGPILERWKPRDLANAFTYANCSSDHDEPYAGAGFSGWVVHWACDGSETRWLTFAGTTDEGSELVLIQAKLVSGRDEEAYRRVLATLTIAPRR